MDLVTEKFKQKIAAVFYLNSRKFNHTRIPRSEASISSYLCTKGWRWVCESGGHRPVITLFIYMKIRILMRDGVYLRCPGSRLTSVTAPLGFRPYEINYLPSSNACPWTKIIPTNSIQNECENGAPSPC